IRSIVLGFLISTLGVVIWSLSPVVFPGIWSIIFMAIVLIFYVLFFSGRWIKNSTQQFRKENFRSIKLKGYKLKWGIVAAILMALIIQISLNFIFRIIEYPEASFKAEYSFLSQIPTGLAWLFIIMASMVAGICEEIGYRGYLQTPLEKKYNPLTAIIITSIVFVVIHLHQAWAAPVIPFIFMASLFLGYMAYCFNSIIPGIIGHVIFDIFNFSYWWSDLLGEFTLIPISKTGIDLHFVITCVVFITSVVLFINVNKMVKNSSVRLSG
ncbi:MAG: CPBP family intramembrane metalloprotease, partial [Bacteroidia bacterium]|nr:CPBP family intramembrane metalloprotease [Bacteroidia bacterium]